MLVNWRVKITFPESAQIILGSVSKPTGVPLSKIIRQVSALSSGS